MRLKEVKCEGHVKGRLHVFARAMYLDMKQCIQWLNRRVQEASVRLNHWILDTMLWRYCIILFARLVTNLFKDIIIRARAYYFYNNICDRQRRREHLYRRANHVPVSFTAGTCD